jgi:hypothetical protein
MRGGVGEYVFGHGDDPSDPDRAPAPLGGVDVATELARVRQRLKTVQHLLHSSGIQQIDMESGAGRTSKWGQDRLVAPTLLDSGKEMKRFDLKPPVSGITL